VGLEHGLHGGVFVRLPVDVLDDVGDVNLLVRAESVLVLLVVPANLVFGGLGCPGADLADLALRLHLKLDRVTHLLVAVDVERLVERLGAVVLLSQLLEHFFDFLGRDSGLRLRGFLAKQDALDHIVPGPLLQLGLAFGGVFLGEDLFVSRAQTLDLPLNLPVVDSLAVYDKGHAILLCV